MNGVAPPKAVVRPWRVRNLDYVLFGTSLCNDGRRGREVRGLRGGRCIPTRPMLGTSRAEML